MTNGEKTQKVFNCEVCEPIPEDDIIHVIFPDKNDSAVGFDWSWWNMEYEEPTTKNDLGVDCIDRAKLLKAMDTWDKFGYTAQYGLERLDKDDKGFVPYVHYDDMIKCVKGMPSVTPQEPIHGKCNQCKYYEGVHNVQGHAPCGYHEIGGVLWNWYCSQFESEDKE